jgi:hypothetical protein
MKSVTERAARSWWDPSDRQIILVLEAGYASLPVHGLANSLKLSCLAG